MTLAVGCHAEIPGRHAFEYIEWGGRAAQAKRCPTSAEGRPM
jgi:hypothetical protein